MEEMQKAIEANTNVSEDILRQAIEKLSEHKEYLVINSRTAKLWIQYISYVDLAKEFIKAERTGNWSAHLSIVSKILNIFSATCHFNSAKSARLYLQMMIQLP